MGSVPICLNTPAELRISQRPSWGYGTIPTTRRPAGGCHIVVIFVAGPDSTDALVTLHITLLMIALTCVLGVCTTSPTPSGPLRELCSWEGSTRCFPSRQRLKADEQLISPRKRRFHQTTGGNPPIAVFHAWAVCWISISPFSLEQSN